MLEKIKNFIPQLLNKAKTGIEKTPKPLKIIAIMYIFFVAMVLGLYLGCWVFLFLNQSASLSELLVFANLLIGNSMIGFIAFILGLFIDANQNNIPDVLEKNKSPNFNSENNTHKVGR